MAKVEPHADPVAALQLMQSPQMRMPQSASSVTPVSTFLSLTCSVVLIRMLGFCSPLLCRCPAELPCQRLSRFTDACQIPLGA